MKKSFMILFAFCVTLPFVLTCTEFENDNPFDSKNLGNNPGGGNPVVTFYCPEECMVQTGTNRPSVCSETRAQCLESVTPSCTPWQGDGCPTDDGYCGSDCELVERSTCEDSFRPTRPESCDVPQCTAGVDCDDDRGYCTIDSICDNDVTRLRCDDRDGEFVYGTDCPLLTFYCPDDCEEEQRANKPSGCFETQSACEVSVTPSCTRGVDCDDDEGYCNDGCTLTTRAACGSGTLSANRPARCEGTFTDSRDNQTYRYVTIGTQVWMAENLSYNATGSWCNGGEDDNCNGYGRHYDWATAMALPSSCNSSSCASQIQTRHRGICPQGWHLPSDDEWTTLVNSVGGAATAGTKLKSQTGWSMESGYRPATDDYGFSALPGGYRWSDGSFYDVGDWGHWWSATEGGATGATGARYRGMYYDYEGVGWFASGKSNGFSVRCLRD